MKTLMKHSPWLLLALATTGLAEPATVPTGLEFDRYVAPSVPPAVSQAIDDGYAVIAFTADSSGEVLDAVALMASDRRFAEALVHTVQKWRLKPTTVDHSPRRELVEFTFKRDGTVRTLTHADGARAAFPSPTASRILTVRRDQLAHSPQRVQTSQDTEHDILRGVSGHGSVTISYVIDEQGRVRIPVVVAADAPALADPAITVARSWRYVPVTYHGRPVLVEDRRTLRFRSRSQ